MNERPAAGRQRCGPCCSDKGLNSSGASSFAVARCCNRQPVNAKLNWNGIRQSESVLQYESSNKERDGLKPMETLQQKIANKFLTTLIEGKALDGAKVEMLRQLLCQSKKPKSDDFVKIFSDPAGGDVK